MPYYAGTPGKNFSQRWRINIIGTPRSMTQVCIILPHGRGVKKIFQAVSHLFPTPIGCSLLFPLTSRRVRCNMVPLILILILVLVLETVDTSTQVHFSVLRAVF